MMRGLLRAAGPQSRERDDTQRFIEGRMAESEQAFVSEETVSATLFERPSEVIAPNPVGIRLNAADDWVSEFPSERAPADSMWDLRPHRSLHERTLPAPGMNRAAPRAIERAQSPRARSPQHEPCGLVPRMARHARTSSLRSAARLADGGAAGWNALVHVASLGTAAGVALELKSRTAVLLAGHGFAKGCSRGVALVASAPWLTRGHPTENTNGSGAQGLWRVVAGISVPSFCSGVAVGGITVSLLLGFVSSPLQSTAGTQEVSR